MSEKSSSAPKGEKLLYTEKVLGQYKLFYIDYKENKRGRFLKVTEKDGRFRSTIIIPEEALEEFAVVINKVIQEHQAYCQSLPQEEPPDETPAPVAEAQPDETPEVAAAADAQETQPPEQQEDETAPGTAPVVDQL
jgi:hypothetical protein